LERFARRCTYYTAYWGDSATHDQIHDTIQERGFSPLLVKKKKGENAKGVDIALTKDMLVHSYRDNLEVAVLVSGDADFVPVVEELKRTGKRVVVAFFTSQDGLNASLRRAADDFVSLDEYV
jgi:uncharacterized protein (TIGR00288 family)